MDLSVIIPARDAANTLGEQLDALVAQRPARLDWEIIVADNGSADDPAATVARYRDAPVPVRLVDASDEPGAGHARNVGASRAMGSRLAFCDADDVVAAGWVAAMHEAIGRHEFVVGALDYERLNPRWVRGARGRISDGVALFDGVVPVASSCNLGVDADLFARSGGFDNRFQRAQDAELSVRLWLEGRPAEFAPAAVVHYRLRAGLADLFRQSRGYARYHAALRSRLSPDSARDARRRTLRSWLWLGASLPLLRTRAGRARWVWVLGLRVGTLRPVSVAGSPR